MVVADTTSIGLGACGLVEAKRSCAWDFDVGFGDGFANAHDAELMAEFHRAAPPGQLAVARAFADPRFRRLAMRILFVQAPQILAPRLSARIRAAILRRLMGGPEGQPWRSLDDAMKELASRANEAPSEAKLRISEWLVERASSTA